jgi:hypothetical protein
VLTVTDIPVPTTVNVRGTIVGVGGNGTGPLSFDLTVYLVEHHTRLVVSGELALASSTTIEVGKTLDLTDLVTKFPANAYIDLPGNVIGVITKDDLIWTVSPPSSNTGPAALSGSILTGTGNGGTVTVTATLPADLNGGSAVTASGTVYIQPPVPLAVTLRIIRTNTPHYQYDKISTVILVPATETDEGVRATGYTGRRWNYNSTPNYVTFTEFKKLYPNTPPQKYYTTTFHSAGDTYDDDDWVDITVPLPPAGSTGYYIFFLESEDQHVRSYNDAKTQPPAEWRYYPDTDFLFYIDPAYLYTNRRLPMYTATKEGYKLAPTNAGISYSEVIPISYDDCNNLPSIMSAAGVGNRLATDYTRPSLLGGGKITLWNAGYGVKW